MKRINKQSNFIKALFLFTLLYVFTACEPEIIIWAPSSDQLVITDYLTKSEDSLRFTEFYAMLENTELSGFLAIRGPYTLFLPNNDAMETYYSDKGIGSLSDLSIEEQKDLVFNHLILTEISSGDIGLGAIREANALGDKVATEFVGADILLNKTAIIIDRDIKCANGYIHEIDQVMKPIEISIFDRIKEEDGLSIFAEGLELTGISDTLSIIDFPYSDTNPKLVRTNFTILAVPDSVFNKFGIYSVQDAIDRFDTIQNTNLTDPDNGFYQFIEYHCLNGTNFLSDFNTELYPILSFNNNVLVSIEEDYKINNNSETGEYTAFLIENSNIPAKNGALHVINKLLPVITPEPTAIIFDTCEQFEMMQADYYMKYYMKFYDGQNTFKNIKWEGDYLQYYYKDHDAPVQVNYDGLQMIGYWWVEVTTPKVMKGKYSMAGYVWGGRVVDVYVDGVKMVHIGSSDSDNVEWGVFEWDETTEHKVKMVATSFSTIFWDTIELTPVLD